MSVIRSWLESPQTTFRRKVLKYLQRDDRHKLQVFLKARENRQNKLDFNNVLLDGMHSSLAYACKIGVSAEMIKIMIDYGADVNHCCSDKKTPLMLAVINQHIDLVKYILNFCQPDLEHLDYNQKNVLNYSYKCKDIEQLLIQSGAKYPLTDIMLSRPSVYSGADLTSATDRKLIDKLWELCTSKLINDDTSHDKLIRLIIDFPTLEQELTNKLLIKTVESGKLKCVQFLIQSGVDCTYVDEMGNSSLSVSVYQNYPVITKYLLSLKSLQELEGREVNIPAIQIASIYGFDETIKLLVTHGADINILDSRRWTALHLAVKHNQISTIIVLIKLNADVLILNDDGQLPVDYLGKGYDVIKRLLYVTAASKSRTGDYRSQFDRAMLNAEKLYLRTNSPKSSSLPPYARARSPTSHNNRTENTESLHKTQNKNSNSPKSENKKAKIKSNVVVSTPPSTSHVVVSTPPSTSRNRSSLYGKTTASSRSRSLSPGVRNRNSGASNNHAGTNSKITMQKDEEKETLQEIVKKLLDSYDLSAIKNVSDDDLILLSKISVALNTIVHTGGKRDLGAKNTVNGNGGTNAAVRANPEKRNVTGDQDGVLSLSPIINRKESGKSTDVEVSSPVSFSHNDSKDDLEKDIIRRISVLHTDLRAPLSPSYHLSSPMLNLQSASVENQLYFDKVSSLLKVNEAPLWIMFSYFSSFDRKTVSSLHYSKLRYTKYILSKQDLIKLFRAFEVVPNICSEAEVEKTITMVVVDSDKSPGDGSKRQPWYKKPKSIPQSISFNYFLKIVSFISRNKNFHSKDSNQLSAANELHALGKFLRILDKSGGRAKLLAGGKVLPKFDLSLGSILSTSPISSIPFALVPVSSGEKLLRKGYLSPTITASDRRNVSVTSGTDTTTNYIKFDAIDLKSETTSELAAEKKHVIMDLFE